LQCLRGHGLSIRMERKLFLWALIGLKGGV
jgi:hypothetical protein